jgi:hypothetical protein
VLLLIYVPVLVSLPILLVIGLVFFVVPGGFIIVLGALYYGLSWLIGVFGFSAARRWRAHRDRARAARPDVAPVRPRGQPRFEPAGASASTPVALALESHRGDVSAANVSVARRADGVTRLEPAELRPFRDSDDRRHVA